MFDNTDARCNHEEGWCLFIFPHDLVTSLQEHFPGEQEVNMHTINYMFLLHVLPSSTTNHMELNFPSYFFFPTEDSNATKLFWKMVVKTLYILLLW